MVCSVQLWSCIFLFLWISITTLFYNVLQLEDKYYSIVLQCTAIRMGLMICEITLFLLLLYVFLPL